MLWKKTYGTAPVSVEVSVGSTPVVSVGSTPVSSVVVVSCATAARVRARTAVKVVNFIMAFLRLN